MCDPVTLAVVAAGGAAAAGGFSAFNSYEQGAAQNKYYQAQADQAQAEGENALKLADKQSTLIQDSAAYEGKRLKESQAETSASQRAALAANGVLGGVTAEDISNNTFNKQLLDEAALRYSADIKSWETNTQGLYNKYAKDVEARDLRYQGKSAKSAANKQVFTTLLSTAASVAGAGAAGGFGGGGGTTLGIGGKGFSNTAIFKPANLAKLR